MIQHRKESSSKKEKSLIKEYMIQHRIENGVEEKYCCDCKLWVPVVDFYKEKGRTDGITIWCKKCILKKRSADGKNNPKRMKKRRKRERDKNHLRYITTAKIKYKENPEKFKERARLYREEQLKTNKEDYLERTRATQRALWKKKYPTFKDDPVYKINHALSEGIRKSLARGKEGKSWKELLPYSLKQFMDNTEPFLQDGMTWKNYGKDGWEVDHLVPISAFNIITAGDEEFQKCWALDNLRPKWRSDNRRKGGVLRIFKEMPDSFPDPFL